MDEYLESNRSLWNGWTRLHAHSPFYDLEGFKAGRSSLKPIELEEVGDVRGKSLLHLQCHFGQDTLSWARLGAARVTGVDFSEPAIAFARELATETGLAERSRFVVSDIYDLPGPLAGETFDVVYTGRGALGWLPDLEPWARAVGSFVAPGGIFYIHEGHPVMWALADDQPSEGLALGYDYWGGETLTFPVEGSYADPTADVDAEVEHGWNHSLGEIVTALADNGLRIELLHEQRELEWPAPFLVDRGDGVHVWPLATPGSLPLMYSLRARKG